MMTPMETYVQQLAVRMLLADWIITYKVGQVSDESSMAEVTPWGKKKVADIVQNEHWTPESPEILREALVHELIHCHLHASDQAFEALEPLIGKPAYLVAYDRFDVATEQAVQQLARIIAPSMPLPPTVVE